MLRALRTVFELIVYTNKNKQEAESIINEIEKGENFFTYIVPVNYCYAFPQEKVHVKDPNIFFGNRSESEFVMVSTSPYDFILYPHNGIPMFPFTGDEKDLGLNLLE
jgi:TFIIF-interacting CTD phosphatase-like protein